MLQMMHWRRRCQAAACRYMPQVSWPRPTMVHQSCVYPSSSSSSSSSSRHYRAPTTFSPLNLNECRHHRRSFSKFSTDEIIVQDPPPPPPPSSSSTAPKKTAAATTSTPATNSTTTTILCETPETAAQSQPKQIFTEGNLGHPAAPKVDANKTLIIELHAAHELFDQIHTEARALLRNNVHSTTSEEVVAMADYFLILVNSPDLEKSLELSQKNALLGSRQQDLTLLDGGEKEAVEMKLRQAVKSMSQLHHVFLTMVEATLPKQLPKQLDEQSKVVEDISDTIPSYNMELHSPMTVGRALKLSRRAEELRLPMHRPLYQRLAMGIVLTSPSLALASVPVVSSESGAEQHPSDDASDAEVVTERTDSTEPTSLVLPKEDLHLTPPISLELLDVFQHARSALKITCQDQLQQLAEDILSEPFWVLLKQEQFEECMGLLRGWRSLFGGGNIDLLNLLGEDNILAASETVKDCLITPELGDDRKTNTHAMELTHLLELAFCEILKGQKQREEDLAQVIFQLSLQSDDNESHGDFEEESESDSDYDDDDFDYGSDGDEELDTPTSTELSTAMNVTPSIVFADADDGTITLSMSANDTANPKLGSSQEKDTEESTIMMGMSDEDARHSIYLRNGVDWVLPDVVPQLEEWNKGKQLTFTHEFERYLAKQIMKEGKNDED